MREIKISGNSQQELKNWCIRTVVADCVGWYYSQVTEHLQVAVQFDVNASMSRETDTPTTIGVDWVCGQREAIL